MVGLGLGPGDRDSHLNTLIIHLIAGALLNTIKM